MSDLSQKNDPSLKTLVGQLRDLIRDARDSALRAVDTIQVRTCWEIGRHIVEFEQGGEVRAAYGKKLLPRLAAILTTEFGKGFDATNLRHMRGFFLAFPIRDAVRRELSWTHYRLLLRVDNTEARQWYVNEAVAQNWSSRALERQIGTLYFERLLLSSDKAGVIAEADAKIAALPQVPREFVRDPVMLEFLGLPGTGKLLESKLEQALMDKLQSFLLELGKGFAFVARRQRISTETKDFYVDLVFYILRTAKICGFSRVSRDAMQGANCAVWPFHTSNLQRSSAPARRWINAQILAVRSITICSSASSCLISNPASWRIKTSARWICMCVCTMI